MMIGTEIQAVFFDAVGTLLFPQPAVGEVYAAIGKKYGSVLSVDEVWQHIRRAFRDQEAIDHASGWRTSEEREHERWSSIVAQVFADVDHRACFSELWDWYSTGTAWRVHNEAEGVFRELQAKNIMLGMASNFDARLRTVAGAFSELALVSGKCLISSELGYRKPSPVFFESMSDLAGFPPDRVLYVGDDRRNDYEGAVAAGMKAVLLAPVVEEADSSTIRNLRDILFI